MSPCHHVSEFLMAEANFFISSHSSPYGTILSHCGEQPFAMSFQTITLHLQSLPLIKVFTFPDPADSSCLIHVGGDLLLSLLS